MSVYLYPSRLERPAAAACEVVHQACGYSSGVDDSYADRKSDGYPDWGFSEK